MWILIGLVVVLAVLFCVAIPWLWVHVSIGKGLLLSSSLLVCTPATPNGQVLQCQMQTAQPASVATTVTTTTVTTSAGTASTAATPKNEEAPASQDAVAIALMKLNSSIDRQTDSFDELRKELLQQPESKSEKCSSAWSPSQTEPGQ